MEALYSNILNLTWQQVVMWILGGILIFLAIKKEMEPPSLLPIGFGSDPRQPPAVRSRHADLSTAFSRVKPARSSLCSTRELRTSCSR